MKKIKFLIFVLTWIVLIVSGCEVKRSEDELREEIKAELVAEQEAEAKAAEDAKKEAELKAKEEEANKLLVVQEDKTLKIMTERLNVRRDPVLDSTKVGQITNARTFEYLEEEIRPDGHKWYKIMYEPDLEGWIAGWYTLKNSEFTQKIGRGNLIKAYDGKIDTMIQGILDPVSEYVKGKGQPVTIEGSNGGEVYVYPDKYIYVYGDMGGDISIGDIAMITYIGTSKVYGATIGMTKEEVIKIIGEADKVELDVTDEVDNFYNNEDLLTYYTGSYNVIFSFNADNQLIKIILGKA